MFACCQKMFLYCQIYEFHGLIRVSQGRIRKIKRWDGKLNHLSRVYSLSNIYTERLLYLDNYRNIIVGGWVVKHTFWDTV